MRGMLLAATFVAILTHATYETVSPFFLVRRTDAVFFGSGGGGGGGWTAV